MVQVGLVTADYTQFRKDPLTVKGTIFNDTVSDRGEWHTTGKLNIFETNVKLLTQ